ncbi:helix-turn-helix domain-containing protein [Streptosporangium sandarakinum]|uniref:helix-turn-helix domain-containing protein n=1 Tax=Streptosporangium sandarakinum TaxID=1260955 RepID=UPI0036B4F681
MSRPLDLAYLLRDDGSVVIPAAVAGPVLRLLTIGLTARVRADGGEVGVTARRVLYALHEAAQRHETAGFLDETPAVVSGMVEVTATDMASFMGCSPQYVRRLCASGVLRARRVGRQWLIHHPATRNGEHGSEDTDRERSGH